MKFAYPIKGKNAEELYKLNSEGQGGFYPIGSNNTYHGGMHFEGEHAVVAIADGEIIAYRYMKTYNDETAGSKTYKYSNCFMLIRHQYKTPKGQELVFYSHYNHLCPWNECDKNSDVEIFTEPGYKVVGASRLPLFSEAKADSAHKLDEKLKKGDLVVATKVDEMWAKTDEGHFFVHTDTTSGNKIYAEPADVPGQAPELDKLVTCKLPIKAGTLIGYTGLCEADGVASEYRAVHVEVFAGDDAEEFIKNPKGDGKKNLLQIVEGATLYHRDKKYPDISAIKKIKRNAGNGVNIVDDNPGGKWVCVEDKTAAIVVSRTLLGTWHSDAGNYSIRDEQLSDIKAAFDSIIPGLAITGDSRLGDGRSMPGNNRIANFSVPSDKASKYWIERSWLDEKHRLKKNQESYECCADNPDAPQFTRVAGKIPYECVVNNKNTEAAKDGETTWYKVNPCGTEGWVKEGDTKKVSHYDWPGFKVVKEESSLLLTYTLLMNTSRDSKIDYGSLPPFFKKIFDEIDTESDSKGVITKSEMKAALSNPVTSRKLSRLISYHQSEWWVDEAMAYWKDVFEILSEPSMENLKKRIQDLCWWVDVHKETNGFPSQSVYHWNPVAFVEHMKTLEEGLLFPLTFVPEESYKEGMRRFGANRPNGRLHAGCDLYAPVGTKIYAMADGVIVDHRPYYLNTNQITVNHGEFIARYGEVKPNGQGLAPGLSVGSNVKRGQHIGYVGKLEFESGTVMSMIHLEIYTDTTNNNIYRIPENTPYQRRTDLVDPTPYLDRARGNLPTA